MLNEKDEKRNKEIKLEQFNQTLEEFFFIILD